MKLLRRAALALIVISVIGGLVGTYRHLTQQKEARQELARRIAKQITDAREAYIRKTAPQSSLRLARYREFVLGAQPVISEILSSADFSQSVEGRFDLPALLVVKRNSVPPFHGGRVLLSKRESFVVNFDRPIPTWGIYNSVPRDVEVVRDSYFAQKQSSRLTFRTGEITQDVTFEPPVESFICILQSGKHIELDSVELGDYSVRDIKAVIAVRCAQQKVGYYIEEKPLPGRCAGDAFETQFCAAVYSWPERRLVAARCVSGEPKEHISSYDRRDGDKSAVYRLTEWLGHSSDAHLDTIWL